MVVKMEKMGIFHGYLGFTEGTYFLRWMIDLHFQELLFYGFVVGVQKGRVGICGGMLETYFE